MQIKELIKTKLTVTMIFNNVDFAIITSNDIEFNGVLKELKPFILENIKIDFLLHYKNKDTLLDYYFGSISTLNVCLIKAIEIGSMTKHGALFTISQLLKEIRPENLMMLGVCCGLESQIRVKKPRKTNIYVSNSITYYECAKIDENYIVRSIVERPSKLLNIFTEEIVDGKTYKVKKGQYICGEKVLNNKKIKIGLQKLYPGAVALDMESYSLALLANNIPYVVIKGASDFGVGKQGSENQEDAMKDVMDYVSNCLSQAIEKGFIVKKKIKLSIFISGCTEDKQDSAYFIDSLATKAYSLGYSIINGYGKGIGEHLILAARKYSYANYEDYNNLLKLYPFPINNHLTTPALYENFSATNRNNMAKSADIAMFVYGDKDGKSEAKGVQSEYQCSISENNLIVPFGSTGGESSKIYSEHKSIVKLYKNKNLLKSYENLDKNINFKNNKEVEEYLSEIFGYLNLLIENSIIESFN